MTVGEIMKIGEEIGKEYVDEIAHKMVKSMIHARKCQLERKLRDNQYKDRHKQMKSTLDILMTLENKGQSEAAYNALFNETRNNLIVSFRKSAEDVSLNLSNAEYFGFTGRLR